LLGRQFHRDLHQHGAEIEALLTRNSNEARALGIRGTPGILVGRQTASNVAYLADLQAAVSNARASVTR
jgi:protein-disulfide isomerase